MKCPKRCWRKSSHSRDSLASSGAGPYSIARNFSMTLMRSIFHRAEIGRSMLRPYKSDNRFKQKPRAKARRLQIRLSRQWVAMFRRVATGSVKFELTLDVGQHAAGAEAEKMRLQPRIAQFFFH